MNWDKAATLGANLVVFVTLAVLVGLGHNSTIFDALLVVAGIITGTGLPAVFRTVGQVVTRKGSTNTPTE